MADLGSTRWPEIERLYYAAREQDAAARAAFLAHACAGDEALLAEVESLLKFETAAGAFLTRPALEQAARALPPPRAGALTGRQIHGYDVHALLGAGGMGEVYLARDLRLGRDVALKILPRFAAGSPRAVRRFEDEARSASVLNHPNIVTIYGVGEDDDVSYIAMERVIGRTLREIIASADLAIPAVLDLAVQLADALAVAHDKGIVHRDLKPENVMVTPEGLLKVLDFGIAKREGTVDAGPTLDTESEAATPETQAGTILGTVGYMSPEQADGRRATAASDQFSFGAILYELLTGRRAFERASRSATLEAIKRDEPEPIESINANVPVPLRRFVTRCLEKDPGARYARTPDLAAELREIRERVTGGGLSRRQVIWLGVAATVATTTAGGLGWWMWPRGPRVRSLALLPFENADQNEELDHLCDGLTDALILRIGVLPSIRVMAHSLVSNFKRSTLDARSFARKIGADSVLTGTVTRRAGELTIAASLVEIASGKPLWSNSYTRSAADLQLVQDAIATEIVNDGIRLQLSDEDRNRLVRHATENADAYELFLQAKYLHEQQERDLNLQARGLFERAIALDPKFALAYAALGATFSTAAINGWEVPADCWPECQRNAREALNRDSELPDAYVENASRQFFYNWDWPAADRDWGLAMRARSAGMFLPLRTGRALQQWALGRTADALRIIREIRALDPLSPLFIVKEAHFLRQDGQLDQAAAAYETALREDPDMAAAAAGLAEIRRAQGRFDEAIKLLRRAIPSAIPQGFDETLDRLLHTAQGADGCRQIERRATEASLHILDLASAAGLYVSPIDRARLYAQLGDSRRALDSLDNALDIRDPGVVTLNADTAWDAVRTHPRFIEAVKKVGLPQG
jgi:serine/threonine protein kinase/Tfp pilus assembly protein PilF